MIRDTYQWLIVKGGKHFSCTFPTTCINYHLKFLDGQVSSVYYKYPAVGLSLKTQEARDQTGHPVKKANRLIIISQGLLQNEVGYLLSRGFILENSENSKYPDSCHIRGFLTDV